MARWREFNVSSATTGGQGLQGTFDLQDGEGYITQDLTAYLKQAQYDRDKQDYLGHRKDGYRKFATIPDGVAIKIHTDHGLDVHDPTFMDNPLNMKKFKHVIASEYPYLMVNKG